MKTINRYKCEGCGMIWDEEWDAEGCCKPKISKVTLFLCDKCKQEYDTKKEAFECCVQTALNL